MWIGAAIRRRPPGTEGRAGSYQVQDRTSPSNRLARRRGSWPPGQSARSHKSRASGLAIAVSPGGAVAMFIFPLTPAPRSGRRVRRELHVELAARPPISGRMGVCSRMVVSFHCRGGGDGDYGQQQTLSGRVDGAQRLVVWARSRTSPRRSACASSGGKTTYQPIKPARRIHQHLPEKQELLATPSINDLAGQSPNIPASIALRTG